MSATLVWQPVEDKRPLTSRERRSIYDNKRPSVDVVPATSDEDGEPRQKSMKNQRRRSSLVDITANVANSTTENNSSTKNVPYKIGASKVDDDTVVKDWTARENDTHVIKKQGIKLKDRAQKWQEACMQAEEPANTPVQPGKIKQVWNPQESKAETAGRENDATKVVAASIVSAKKAQWGSQVAETIASAAISSLTKSPGKIKQVWNPQESKATSTGRENDATKVVAASIVATKKAQWGTITQVTSATTTTTPKKLSIDDATLSVSARKEIWASEVAEKPVVQQIENDAAKVVSTSVKAKQKEWATGQLQPVPASISSTTTDDATSPASAKAPSRPPIPPKSPVVLKRVKEIVTLPNCPSKPKGKENDAAVVVETKTQMWASGELTANKSKPITPVVKAPASPNIKQRQERLAKEVEEKRTRNAGRENDSMEVTQQGSNIKARQERLAREVEEKRKRNAGRENDSKEVTQQGSNIKARQERLAQEVEEKRTRNAGRENDSKSLVTNVKARKEMWTNGAIITAVKKANENDATVVVSTSVAARRNEWMTGKVNARRDSNMSTASGEYDNTDVIEERSGTEGFDEVAFTSQLTQASKPQQQDGNEEVFDELKFEAPRMSVTERDFTYDDEDKAADVAGTTAYDGIEFRASQNVVSASTTAIKMVSTDEEMKFVLFDSDMDAWFNYSVADEDDFVITIFDTNMDEEDEDGDVEDSCIPESPRVPRLSLSFVNHDNELVVLEDDLGADYFEVVTTNSDCCPQSPCMSEQYFAEVIGAQDSCKWAKQRSISMEGETEESIKDTIIQECLDIFRAMMDE